MTTESREIATEVKPSSLAELRSMGEVFFQSGMFPNIRSAAQAVVKIMAGRELGLPPVYSMTKVHIVESKIYIAAEIMAVCIKKSGDYDYKIVKLDDNECLIQFSHKGEPLIPVSSFTMADAKRAGVVRANSGWEKYPRAMLFSKAMSQGTHLHCPHLIAGAFTPEDFGWTEQGNTLISTETGEVVSNIKPSTDESQVQPAVPTARVTEAPQPQPAKPMTINAYEAWLKKKGKTFIDVSKVLGGEGQPILPGTWLNEHKEQSFGDIMQLCEKAWGIVPVPVPAKE